MTDIEKLIKWIDAELEKIRKEINGYEAGKEQNKNSMNRRRVMGEIRHEAYKLLLK